MLTGAAIKCMILDQVLILLSDLAAKGVVTE